MLSKEEFENLKLVGIDHSITAINEARNRFPTNNFYASDINDIDELNLGKFDLIISIGTLQSPSINYKLFLMNLVQNYLGINGAIILGFPNSRWIGGELIYGAMAPNYNYSEMSLLYNDVIFAKKYLQQKKFRVTITGREYIFLTATKIGSL
jgi:trans-aconitate methyltransferase